MQAQRFDWRDERALEMVKRLGAQIRRRRERLGIELDTLAGQMGVPPATLARVEEGQGSVMSLPLCLAALALDCHVSLVEAPTEGV